MEPSPAIPQPREITLREYYAGLAMAGKVSQSGFSMFADDTVINAVRYADALIAELSKK